LRRSHAGSAGNVARAGVEASSVARRDVCFDPASLASWRRLNGAVLEYARQWTWIRDASRVAREILRPGSHELIVSCGPPHLVHELARRLGRSVGLPCVLDLRDPWSLNQRVPAWQASPFHFWVAERLERRAVLGAALVVMNTEPARDAMRARYPSASERIIAVPNGVDDPPLAAPPDRARFVIAYAGTIYLDRSPEMLFRAARRVVDALALAPGGFALEFMGHMGDIDGRSLDDMTRDAGVKDYVRFHPPGSLADVERFLARASVLVSLPQDSDLAIPSKVFDYLRYPAWLLALAGPTSATAQLLRGSEAHVVDPEDLDSLTRVLTSLVEAHRAGVRPSRPAGDAQLTRRHQADRLFAAIDHVLG
jgi:glycosyltransferase involved in cell wall biosynthesis